MSISTNPELELAADFLGKTRRSLFLTGKAGSGKTTFLHQLKSQADRRMAVVAPTGVAAINAGGMTIHSLFQLPLGLHVPGMERDSPQRRKMARNKVQLIRSLDLLVIDEISMVRADLLDAVDETLRRIRNVAAPFGGVQLLMIGDLYQLPPVVKPEEWQILNRYYESPFFFSSQSLNKLDYVTIELTKIYRQADPTFVDLLNEVREDRLTAASLRRLNSRFVPNFRAPPDKNYICLTATNAAAAEVNLRNLSALTSPEKTFLATIAGDFPPSSWPAEEKLALKIGAQVMFIKNDNQSDRRYFNGKIGQVVAMDEQGVTVRCPGDSQDIQVTAATWENIRYTLNEQTQKIAEQIVGTFTQLPLKLAWAITIHKSQGLTFERVIIDAGAAFASGQVYVALSRCRTFDGLVLDSKISEGNVRVDPMVQKYTRESQARHPTLPELRRSRREFQTQQLSELFDFSPLVQAWQILRGTCQMHRQRLPESLIANLESLENQLQDELNNVGERFQPQLRQLIQSSELPEDNIPLQNRLRQAAGYFVEKLLRFEERANGITIAVDNQQVQASLNSLLYAAKLVTAVRRGSLHVCLDGYRADVVQRAAVSAELRLNAELNQTPTSSRRTPQNVPHASLYQQLVNWRAEVAESRNCAVFEVFPRKALDLLVKHLPTTEGDLAKISGFGPQRIKNHGTAICELIREYCQKQGIQAVPLKLVATPPSDTQQQTLDLWRAGHAPEEIAQRRQLAVSTIESHLARFISAGVVSVYDLLPKETIEEIAKVCDDNPQFKFSELKAHFGDKYSYREIRWVNSHRQNLTPHRPETDQS